jgi:hypothetical protein
MKTETTIKLIGLFCLLLSSPIFAAVIFNDTRMLNEYLSLCNVPIAIGLLGLIAMFIYLLYHNLSKLTRKYEA